MIVETVPLNTIVPYFRNPRVNNDTVKALIKSIKRYGFNVPIVVDKHNTIITGHARYKALQQMDSVNAEIIRAVDLTENEVRKFRIEDNTTQETSVWETETLREEIKGIKTWDSFLSAFNGTLDDVLPTLPEYELDIGGVEAPDQERVAVEEKNEGVKSFKELRANDKYIMCPYCAEYHSKEDLNEMRIENE